MLKFIACFISEQLHTTGLAWYQATKSMTPFEIVAHDDVQSCSTSGLGDLPCCGSWGEGGWIHEGEMEEVQVPLEDSLS